MADKTLNALGMKCPMPVLKTKKELRGMAAGQTIEVIVDDKGALKDIPAMLNKTGDELVETNEESDKITFIGEETGGAYYGNNSGDWINLTLPNTLIQISIPARNYLLSVSEYPEQDRGVIPDIDVSPTIENILNKKDTQLECALETIRNRQNAHL